MSREKNLIKGYLELKHGPISDSLVGSMVEYGGPWTTLEELDALYLEVEAINKHLLNPCDKDKYLEMIRSMTVDLVKNARIRKQEKNSCLLFKRLILLKHFLTS